VKKSESRNDRRLLMIVSGAALALVIVVSLLAPSSAANDPEPTTTNAGPMGAKAAYLLMQAMGRETSRWTRPLAELPSEDAERTTLVLAAPQVDETEVEEIRKELKEFMQAGGRVVATGASGAELLPGGKVEGSTFGGPCRTTPEGPGLLAKAGSVRIANGAHWADDDPQYVVEQRCGRDAVVVRYAYGKGEAIWWSSATPLTNDALKQDASLKLLLASVGDGRAVIFDESLHGEADGLWSKARGLPLGWLAAQLALLVVLLVLSFSRRRGPVRMPVKLPRSSPVEFAGSMGDLYSKAGATKAATEAARRTLVRVLVREAGVPQATVELGPAAIAEALGHRFNGDWSRLAQHMELAQAPSEKPMAPRSALTLVKAMREDAEEVRKHCKF
jgi:hypothetical protein